MELTSQSIDTNQKLSFSERDLNEIKKNLQLNQKISAKVLEILANNKVMLQLDHLKVIGQTNIPLLKGQNIPIQVQSLRPNLVLQISNNTTSKSPVSLNIEKTLLRLNIPTSTKNLAAAEIFIKNSNQKLSSPQFLDFLDKIRHLDISSKSQFQLAFNFFKTQTPIPSQNTFNQIQQNLSQTSQQNSSSPLLDFTQLSQNLSTENKNSLKFDTFLPSTDSQKLDSNLKTIVDKIGFHTEKNILLDQMIRQFNPQKFLDFSKSFDVFKNDLKISLDNLSNSEAKFELEQLIAQTNRTISQLLQNIKSTDSSQYSLDSKTDPDLFSQLNNLTRRLLFEPSNQIETILQKLLPQSLSQQNIHKSLLLQSFDNIQNETPTQNTNQHFQETFKQKLLDLLDNSELKNIHNKSSANQTKEPLQFLTQQIQSSQLNQVLDPEHQIIFKIPTKPSADSPHIKKEIDFEFSKEDTRTPSGTKKVFKAFFSMELSQLGFFEIELLEHKGHLGISIYSEKEKTSQIFKDGFTELESNLKDKGFSQVDLSLRKKNLKTSSRNSSTQPVLSHHFIDIEV